MKPIDVKNATDYRGDIPLVGVFSKHLRRNVLDLFNAVKLTKRLFVALKTGRRKISPT
jgi:hypothetical protein